MHMYAGAETSVDQRLHHLPQGLQQAGASCVSGTLRNQYQDHPFQLLAYLSRAPHLL